MTWQETESGLEKADSARGYIPPRKEVLLLVGLMAYAAVIWIGCAGRADIVSTMEASRAIVTRGMIRSGDYVVPRLGAQVYLAKPALFYWASVLSAKACGGTSEFSVRLVSAVSAMLTVLVIHLAIRRVFNVTTGIVAGIVTATTPIIYEQATIGMVNMMLTLFVAMALFGAFHLIEADRHKWWHAVVCGVGLGAGAMTKGPLVFLFFIPTLVVYLFFARRWRAAKTPWWLLVLGVMFAVILPWPIMLLQRYSMKQLMGFVENELILHRYVQVGESNYAPIWHYVVTIPLISIPWTLVYPIAFLKGYARDETETRKRLLLFARCWVVGSVVILSVISSAREARYALPIFPALSVLTADVLVRGLRQSLTPGRNLYIRRLTSVTVYGICLAPIIIYVAWRVARLPDSQWLHATVVVMGAAGAFGVYAYHGLKSRWAGILAVAVVMIGAKMFANFGIVPQQNTSRSPRAACETIRLQVPEGAKIYLYGTPRRPVMFYMDSECLPAAFHEHYGGLFMSFAQGAAEDFGDFLSGKQSLFVCIESRDFAKLAGPGVFEAEELGRAVYGRGELVLIRVWRRT